MQTGGRGLLAAGDSGTAAPLDLLRGRFALSHRRRLSYLTLPTTLRNRPWKSLWITAYQEYEEHFTLAKQPQTVPPLSLTDGALEHRDAHELLVCTES